jgi:S1-C subfamily serine protease
VDRVKGAVAARADISSSIDLLKGPLDKDVYIFAPDSPEPNVNHPVPVAGKNDRISVNFMESVLNPLASVVQRSLRDEVALIKIDSPRASTPAELSDDDHITAGRQAVTFEYATQLVKVTSGDRTQVAPRYSVSTIRVASVLQNQDRSDTNSESNSIEGEFRITVPFSPASIGGPVFNSNGKVIGVIEYSSPGDETTLVSPVRNVAAVLTPRKLGQTP